MPERRQDGADRDDRVPAERNVTSHREQAAHPYGASVGRHPRKDKKQGSNRGRELLCRQRQISESIWEHLQSWSM